MAKKPLRDITPKGDTKLLNKDLKGVRSSTTDSPDLDDLLMDPDNMKGTKDFVKKYMKTQTHDDRVGNKSDGAPYSSKGKAANYPKADADMYEAADCTCDDDKHSCAVHGKKGKKLLLGGKKNVKENVEFSNFDAKVGAAPSGMVKHAENTWKNAEQYFDKPPTQLTGEGKPFLSKMGDTVREAVREVQMDAVANLREAEVAARASKIKPFAPGPKEPSRTGVRSFAVDIVKKFPNASKETHHDLLMKKMAAHRNGVAYPESHAKNAIAWVHKHKEHYGIKESAEELDEVVARKPSEADRHTRSEHPIGLRGIAHEIVHKFPDAGKEKHYELFMKKASAIKRNVDEKLAKIHIDHYHKNPHLYNLKLKEDAPPSKSSEEWIKKNKTRFTKEYGKKKGENILYGKAWNDYKEKH